MPGNSMSSLVPQGLAAIYDPDLSPTNGQVAAVYWRGKLLVRRLFRGATTLMLASDSHADCDDVVITKPKPTCVLGTVIWAQSAGELE